VAKATLYNHFRTKDEVARALLAAEVERIAALAGGLSPAAGLTAVADEVATHPVLRRLADDEPAVLTGLLSAAPGRWAEVVDRLATAVGTDTWTAEVLARWLLGLVLQPGDPLSRRDAAARLAGLVART
jgi:AcrR family transcriptional regulator